MPVRLLHSSVLRWPDRDTVDAAVRQWVAGEADRRTDLVKLGYFGSYARGDWGVGSDLDLVAVVDTAERPFLERGRDWDLTGLPVPAEILVYTRGEWDDTVARGDRFAGVMSREVVWIFDRSGRAC